MSTVLIVGLFVCVVIGLYIGRYRFLPFKVLLLREILKVISTEVPIFSPSAGQPIHDSFDWKKDVRTFRDNYKCKRMESIEATWYPNKQWFFIAYNNGYRNKVIWYIVKNTEERTGASRFCADDKNELRLASSVPFGEDTYVEISPHDWRVIQTAIAAVKQSVESFNRKSPAISTSLAR